MNWTYFCFWIKHKKKIRNMFVQLTSSLCTISKFIIYLYMFFYLIDFCRNYCGKIFTLSQLKKITFLWFFSQYTRQSVLFKKIKRMVFNWSPFSSSRQKIGKNITGFILWKGVNYLVTTIRKSFACKNFRKICQNLVVGNNYYRKSNWNWTELSQLLRKVWSLKQGAANNCYFLS